VAAAWRQLPRRQLVVIGAPGAGKTSLAVLLVCGLLRDRQPSEPVPVLLNMAGWNPLKENVNTWLTSRLAEQYPVLLDEVRFGVDAVDRLLDQGRILPVLDGLDEMPEELHAAAVAGLTDAVGIDSPLVLTCRSQEYEHVIANMGTPLARAAVVELEPVTGSQVAEYLPVGQIDGQGRWAQVTAHLMACPNGVLGKALSTPLMVYLARASYTPPRKDPAHLLTFTDAAEVEDHLLRDYLPSVYASGTPRRSSDVVASMRDYPPDKAQEWLEFLARHLHQHNTYHLAWWRLINAVPRNERLCGLVGVLVGSLTTGLAAGLFMGPWMGIVFGLIGGFLVGGMSLNVEATPHLVRRRPKWKTMGALVVWSVITVLTLGQANRPEPLDAGPALENELLDPNLSLRQDRAATLAVGLVAGVPLGLGFGMYLGLKYGPVYILGGGFAWALTVALGVVMQSAWAKFGIARCWLAGRRLLPWHLMRLLDDAYRRGVLRRSGAEYQFRHSRLQDYLAAQRPP
jgi:hypothetical protein